MHALRLAFASALVLGLAACGSDEPLVMPDVTGEKLNVALSDIKRAGFDDEPEVLGGGMFGVIDESNWTVCEQEPAAKDQISDKPRLTVDRSCGGDDAPKEVEEPTHAATPDPDAVPASAIVDISVDELLDRLNSTGMGGIKVGDQFRVTAELFESDAWGVGASGDFAVMLKAKGGKDDLTVFVNESDADEWKNGTTVEMIVEASEVTIDGETTDGWLKAKSVKTLSGSTTKKAKEAATNKELLQDLAAYADAMNTSLGRTVIDSIEPSRAGFDVLMNPNMAGVTVEQAQALISRWNQNIVDLLADAGRGAGDASVKYYLAGELLAQNKEILDPWSVDFKGALDQ